MNGKRQKTRTKQPLSQQQLRLAFVAEGRDELLLMTAAKGPCRTRWTRSLKARRVATG